MHRAKLGLEPRFRKRFGVLTPNGNAVNERGQGPCARRPQQVWRARPFSDFIVLVLSIAVLVLVALSLQPRFDYEHEHRFAEHKHVVFCPLTTKILMFYFGLRNSLFDIRY